MEDEKETGELERRLTTRDATLLTVGAVVGAWIFLVAALLAEQHDEWAVGRRYFSLEFVAPLNPEPKALTDDRQPNLPAA